MQLVRGTPHMYMYTLYLKQLGTKLMKYIVFFFSPHQANADEDGTSQVLCRTHRESKIIQVGGLSVRVNSETCLSPNRPCLARTCEFGRNYCK